MSDLETLGYAAADIYAGQRPHIEALPEGTLLARAATGLAGVIARVLAQRWGRVYGSRVLLLVGSGHNGADALLAGARLRRRGVEVNALLVAGRAHPGGIEEFRAAGGRLVTAKTDELGEPLKLLAAADLVVDGIVGIGGTPGLAAPAGKLTAAIPPGVPVVAVDLPSGVDPDTGETPGEHVLADVTVAFGGYSAAVLLPPGAYAAGTLEFVDVGIRSTLDQRPPAVRRLTPAAVAADWPVPPRVAHKYARGVLGLVAGSDAYPGAAVLAAAGAIRAGIGVVRFIGPPLVTDHVLRAMPEAVPDRAGGGRVQAYLLGSGVADDSGQDDAIDHALASGQPCVVDAGALDACVRARAAGERPAPGSQILLTPHAGELARLLVLLGHTVERADVEARPAHHARWLAREADATVLLKGSTTLVASPNGTLYSQDTGPSWMATAGSGDVLAGIAGTLMATTTLDAVRVGAMATYVHGRAGAHASAGGPISALQIAEAIPSIVVGLLATHR